MELNGKSYFFEYSREIGLPLKNGFDAFDFSDQKIDLGYQTAAAAVFSANIEGNTLDLNTFMNLRLAEEKFRDTKEADEIENLINAYQFAQQHSLNQKNLLTAHRLLSTSFLIESKQGHYRNERSVFLASAGWFI